MLTTPGIQPDIFQELLLKHYKSNRTCKSTDIKVVEIEGSACDVPTFRSFVVPANKVRDWLTQDESASQNGEEHSRDNTRARIILGSGHRVAGEYARPGGGIVLGVAGQHSPLLFMPFSQDDYDLVERSFRLPKVTKLLLTTGSQLLRGHCDVHQILLDGNSQIFGLTLYPFSSLLVGIKISVSLSYDVATGAINALLIGSELPGDLGSLEEDLRHLAPLASNPFLLPTLVCQRLTEAIGASIGSNFNALHRVETSSGQTGIGVLGNDGNAMHPGRCDDPQLPVAILGLAQMAIAIETYIRGHALTVNSVREELRRFPWHLLPATERARAQEQNELLAKQLDWITQSLEISKLRAGHLRQRADVQAMAINNLLSQRNNETTCAMAGASTRIAHDTRRDSAAMKSIAILTMVFLPATFIATYFTTPAMVATQPSQSLYWAVTLAVTAVVITSWLVFFYGWVKARLENAQ
ncbi:hypothetical protein F5Y14DRAFT_455575 [Nemania sp. NC0429]|nr:hypothetical protein F5Y14DRAFT_455552 [Nemania sp. NC0429]KAI1109911.1 hypothetical protein F5Y14DRAFT_455575 [Nemania sp. NC0429]